MHPIPPPSPKTPSWHTKSGRETDRKEISLKEKHIRLHHPATHAYSQPISVAAMGYSIRYNPSTDSTVCLSLHFELACCATKKANGFKVQSIAEWCLNTFLQTNIRSYDWCHDFLHIVTGWKFSLSPVRTL